MMKNTRIIEYYHTGSNKTYYEVQERFLWIFWVNAFCTSNELPYLFESIELAKTAEKELYWKYIKKNTYYGSNTET